MKLKTKLIAVAIITVLLLFCVITSAQADISYDNWQGFSTEGIHKVMPSFAETAKGVLYKYDSEEVMVYIAKHGVRYVVKTTTGNHWLQYEFRNPNDISPIINTTKKSVTWTELYNNVDITYTLLVDKGTRTSSGLKQEIIVKAEPQGNHFDEKITVSPGVTYEQINNVFWFYYDDDNSSTDDRLFYIGKPYICFGSGNESIIVEEGLKIKKVIKGGSAYIRIDVSEFLKNNIFYPFTIDPTTYSAATNIITVTGYTQTVPCTFTDIFNADVAGGWGVVTRLCTSMFCFDAFLQIGDGSNVTWFKDTSKHIRFNDFSTAHWQHLIDVQDNAHFQNGELIDATKHLTEKGCSYYSPETYYLTYLIYSAVNADVELYSFDYHSDVASRYNPYILVLNGRIWNVLLDRMGGIRNSDADLYNILLTNCKLPIANKGTMDEIKILDNTANTAMHFHGINETITVKNTISVNTGGKLVNAYNCGVNLVCHLINVDSDLWVMQFQGSPNTYVYRKYEFDLNVTDKDGNIINGAAVKIWDITNNLVVDVTTGADGKIATQVLTHGFWTTTSSGIVHPSETMKTPHTITISKAGYQTYQTIFIIDNKADCIIALSEPCSVQPVITDWYNNLTNNNSTFVYINSSKCVYFNVTANQTIDNYYWYKNENYLSSENYDNITTCWNNTEETGILKVWGNNTNGTTNTVVWYVGENMSMLNESVSLLNESVSLLLEEEKMIGTTVLFGIVLVIALLFLVIAIFGIGEEHYFDVLSAFVSPTILMLLGYQCYVSEALQEFEFLGLLLIVVSVIIYIYGIILVISVAMNEFGYGEREEDRGADYEYK